MELKTLVLGMFIALSAFSVKVGIGWVYLCSQRSRGQKIAISFAVLAGYAALFALVYQFVVRVNVIANYDLFLPLWRNGITLHWITAILLLIWGLYLLKSKREQDDCGSRRSKAWIALVVPCPVCAGVILMSVSCLALYFPDDAAYAVSGLFILFVSAAIIGGLAVSYMGAYPEETLAQAMIMIALYFIVSAVVTPQFAEIGRMYRIAAYSIETREAMQIEGWGILGAMALLLAAGFFHSKREIGKFRRSIS